MELLNLCSRLVLKTVLKSDIIKMLVKIVLLLTGTSGSYL